MSKTGLTDKEWEKFARLCGREAPEHWIDIDTEETFIRDRDWVRNDFRRKWKESARNQLAFHDGNIKYAQSLIDEAEARIDKIQFFIDKAGD